MASLVVRRFFMVLAVVAFANVSTNVSAQAPCGTVDSTMNMSSMDHSKGDSEMPCKSANPNCAVGVLCVSIMAPPMLSVSMTVRPMTLIAAINWTEILPNGIAVSPQLAPPKSLV